jgi:acyl transferase domain-containing protein/NADPH:quinone reductase-like Zn-dependent oxidoreductase/NADP-dependent 3-hydroxy acid dehydrogenase YdfG/acyl carrier protein
VLKDGRSVITEVDEKRFGTRQHWHPDRMAPGRAVTFAAGQVDGVFDFDPFYFGLSPREAAIMDPQQRILLEVAVEALEHAGVPADTLAGTEVGVYVGASSLDYGTHAQLDPAAIEPQSMTGNTLSIIANRISYVFDLKGPSYVVDTACSSSLIALHHALEDIRSGRIDTAIVGGVSLLLHPVPFIGFSRASMLSATGRCRAFDAGADGYVRSEGALALVLRAEDVARSNGDPVRARFAASGINADGRTAGLSLPSMEAQASLLSRVYDGAGIDPDRLAFVEAHGTGTRVGDPIEAEAIGRVLGQRRRERLLVGSSKSNFGHLEPASGLVGVLKAERALANDCLPASIHFETPNPDIRFDELNLSVAATATPLERGAEPRLAGVNSFGFGGANAHVVLEDGDRDEASTLAPRTDAPLVISAATAAGLKALAAATAERLAAADTAAYANAAAWRRERLAHRAVIAPAQPAAMGAALAAVAAGNDHPLAVVREAVTRREVPVFIYSGNGSQWAGMGRAAYQGEPDFRHAFEATDRLFMSVAGWSLVTMLFSADLETEIERTEIAQPLLFALQVALTEALRSRGVRPGLVIGHSVGEVAAAWAAGALSLPDAVRVIHARSTHQEVTRHLGGMAALLLPAAEARGAIAPFPGLEVAAVNSDRSITLSGPAESLAAFAKAARGKRWAVKRLDLDYPFHCALVDPIREPLLASLSTIRPRKATVPMISTVTGGMLSGEELGASYWWDNVRRPVSFRDAAVAALSSHRLFVEIGPRPVLTGYLADIARGEEKHALAIPSFRQGEDAADPVGRVVRDALAAGAAVDDLALFGPKVAPADLLPTYPFQRETYRIETTAERVRLDGMLEHPFLGMRLREEDREWRGALDAKRLPFLADHKVEDAVVFPAAGFVEMLLAAGRILHPGAPVELRDLDIVAPLVLDGEGEREVRTREMAPGTFLVESRPRLSADGFAPLVKATVGRAPAPPAAERMPIEGETVDSERLYALTQTFGLPYGTAFRRAESVTVGAGRARVRLLPGLEEGFALDPTLFDSCFHALFAFLAGRTLEPGTAVLPVRVGRLVLAAGAGAPVEADLVVRLPTEGIVEADFIMVDAAGAVVAVAEAVRFQAVPLGRPTGTILHAAPALKRLARAADPSPVRAELLSALVADAPEPAETALLVDAGVQAAAAEALRPLLAEPLGLDALVARGLLAPSALPLAARLLMALEGAGTAEEVDGAWRLDGEGIAVADAVELLLAEHPDRLAEAAIVAALPGFFAAAFRDGLAETPPVAEALLLQLLTDAPFSAPLFAALAAQARTALASDGPVRIGVLGAGNVAFLRTLAEAVDPSRATLVVTDRNEQTLERARLVFERRPGVAFAAWEGMADDGHPLDALLVAPTFGGFDIAEVKRVLKPGGALFGAVYAPALFADALGGLAAPWWATSVDPASPVGALSSVAEWQAVLGSAGFERVTAGALASGETDAVVFAAALPAGEAAMPAPAIPALHAAGGDARRVLDALSAMAEPPASVQGLDAPAPEGAVVVAVDADAADLSGRLAALGRFLVSLGTDKRAVTLVTFGAESTGAKELRPGAAALAAFGRVAANEFPFLDIRLVDVSPSLAPSEAAVRLLAELRQPNAEREIVLASDHRSALRYLPLPPERTDGEATVLAVAKRGSIDNIAWVPRPLPPLEPGEVRIRVEATGLNFRDVMWTLGLLPHEALEDGFAGPTLGMECAGVIEAVGEGVDMEPGDLVVAFAPQCFASHVTVRADAVARRPAALDAAAAATLPVAFLTAFYALVELARLEEGETVLIHGGAGGVGLAALQIAKWRGARVFATAGTAEKRALLERLGAEKVFSSRGLTFADEVRAATGGEGVDVVLNSLAGEAMERSVAALKPFGRFCELGKRDFYEGTKLGLRPFRQNLSYFGIDADQLMRHRAALASRLLRTLMALFETGELSPLPYRRFAAGGVRDAFRLMQQSGHIGKIVVDAPEPSVATRREATVIDSDKTYLLVGGTSGFGFATAEWLVAEGARHLVLASRSGIRDEAVAAAVEKHRAAGVDIEVAALDATDAAAVATLVRRIAAERPLGGVFHMAMVLDDALIASLDEARHATAIDPKVKGLEALEAAVADVPLDLFVVYSSITVPLGNPGQANYVAANAWLEAAMRRRRARGLPGLAVAWGAIADAGVLARDMKTSELLAKKLGRHAITASEALAGLKALLAAGAMRQGPAVRLVGKVDWAAAKKDLVLAHAPAFEDIAEEVAPGAADGDAGDLAERLKALGEAEAVAEVTRLLAAEISRILKMPVAEVDPRKPLTALGMDSLMGVELRMAAEARLGVDIPLMSLAAGATLTDIARKVVARLRGAGGAVTEEAEELASRHLGTDLSAVDNVGELEAAFRERTSEIRTILG